MEQMFWCLWREYYFNILKNTPKNLRVWRKVSANINGNELTDTFYGLYKLMPIRVFVPTKCGAAAVLSLGLWARIPPGAWLSVSCDFCVFLGRGFSDGPITRPEKSYRMCCVIPKLQQFIGLSTIGIKQLTKQIATLNDHTPKH